MRMIKARRMRGVGFLAFIEDKRIAYKILVGISQGKKSI
jgi:hypothetical protein